MHNVVDRFAHEPIVGEFGAEQVIAVMGNNKPSRNTVDLS